MDRDDIPDDIRRFILISIASIPHLEAILLLRRERARTWSSEQVAQRLYVNEKAAAELLAELHVGGMLALEQEEPPAYRYLPQSPELAQTIDHLASIYTNNLIKVTNLIHSKTSKNAQRFADAFIWRKDS